MVKELFIGISLTILGTIIGSFGALFFKYTSRHVSKNILKILKKPTLYIGGALYGLSALIFVFALKFGDLSILYPVVSLSYIWIALLSIYFLKEKMNLLKWSGIALIIIGVIFVGLGA